jgi:hypothetical protein
LERESFLKSPDIREPLHGIAGMAENDSLQKIEFPLE